jgi:hypothetical protein
VPIPRLVATPCSSSLSFPIWPPVETSGLGDISIVVISSHGDICRRMQTLSKSRDTKVGKVPQN